MTARSLPFLSAALLLAGALAPAARADILPENSKGVSWEGVLEVPEPVEGVRFFLFPTGFGSYSSEVVPGEPFHATKFPARLYALRQEPPSGRHREEEAAFFARADLPKSEPLDMERIVPQDDPRARIRIEYRLEELEGDEVRLSWVKRSWDRDGKLLGEERGGYQPKRKAGDEPPADAPPADAPPADAPPADAPARDEQPASPEPPPGGGRCELQPVGRDTPLVGLSLLALAALLTLAWRRAA